LPAMDDDDLRRGKPTCHRAFDEATAILVGDALQSYAFELLSRANKIDSETQIKMIHTLACASGFAGMAGGQSLDLQSEGERLELSELEKMHELKTGALIRAAVKLGAVAANCNQQQLTALDKFAKKIGLAFQIQDDILDVEGDTTLLGKQTGADAAHHKNTYPQLLGLDDSKKLLSKLNSQALQILDELPLQTGVLKKIAVQLIYRNT